MTSTAVVCVECQNGVLGPESVLPALAADNRGLVENLRRLVDAARSAGILVVHSTYEGPLGDAHPGTSRVSHTLRPATVGWASRKAETQVLAELLADNDLVLPRHHGLFPTMDSELLPVLDEIGVNTVILTGAWLNLALYITAEHLTQAGYQLVVPRDAVGGTSVGYGNQVLDKTIAGLGRLTMIDDLVAEWNRRN
jgi:nicotinamidase-related amidase